MIAAVLLSITYHSRRGFAHLNLSAHLLDLRALLFELRSENFHSLLLLGNSGFQFSDRRLLFLDSFVLFQEFIEQHRVHCLVPHGVDFAILIAHHQLRIYLFYLLGYQPKLRNTLWIYLLLVTESDRLQRKERFAGLL